MFFSELFFMNRNTFWHSKKDVFYVNVVSMHLNVIIIATTKTIFCAFILLWTMLLSSPLSAVLFGINSVAFSALWKVF